MLYQLTDCMHAPGGAHGMAWHGCSANWLTAYTLWSVGVHVYVLRAILGGWVGCVHGWVRGWVRGWVDEGA